MISKGLKCFLGIANYFFTLFCFGILMGLVLSFFSPSAPSRRSEEYCLSILTEKICITHERVF